MIKYLTTQVLLKMKGEPAKSFHFIPPTTFYEPLPQKLLQSLFFAALDQLHGCNQNRVRTDHQTIYETPQY